ncbi:hypothetical protein ACWF94_04595 [Streptomyces sp. NPDC055078]
MAAGVFVVATGCSAQDSDADPEAKDAAPASVSPSPSGPPLTAGQLKPLLLREQDVPQADSAPVQGPVPQYDRRVLVEGPDCQEVFDALVAHDASTSLIQDFWWKNKRWGGRTWLASYAGTEASEQFQRLAEGLKTCKTLVGQTPEGKLNSRITVAKAPALGDEAVAFGLSMDGPDRTVLTDRHILVRVGALTVDFSDRGSEHTPKFPLDVVVGKQLDRLTQGTPL